LLPVQSGYTLSMPGGGRRTHEFPHGKPLLLTLAETGFAAVIVLVLGIAVLVFGLNGWLSIASAFALFVAYVVTRSLLLTRYERTGEAVPVNRISVVVKFPHGFPKPMLAARLAFFVVAAVMLVFGIAPFPFDVARYGIIGCVFGLIGVAAVNLLLEGHYVKAGRATEVEYTTKHD
jgi:hypothetical protein